MVKNEDRIVNQFINISSSTFVFAPQIMKKNSFLYLEFHYVKKDIVVTKSFSTSEAQFTFMNNFRCSHQNTRILQYFLFQNRKKYVLKKVLPQF